MINELIDATNKRLADIDSLILMNANSSLKLIDMQLQLLNELEEQTEDTQVLRQLDQQINQLRDNRVLVVLINKYVVSDKLDEREKRVLTKILKRV